ncbi:PTS cellobiose transporter subunit IIC [Neobacillus drentensis]|uniref:PTS cellobiose transporter subunit IIC n=1 Tax=Neobacillus drentensis TaxID=220684 RepID=UPI002FFF318F
MSKYEQFIESKVMPVAGRIAGQRHLQSLRDGLVLTMPLIIIGSIFLIIANLPIPGYPEFMASIFGDAWKAKLNYPVGATFDIMALIAAFGVAYRLAEKYSVDPLTAGAISVTAFLLATPYEVPFLPDGAKEAVMVGGGIPTSLTGSKGLFVAMIIAILSTEIYRYILQKKIVIKMPDGVPPAVSKSFVALIPGFVVVTLVWVLRLIIEQTDFHSLHNVVSEIIGKPLGALGGSLTGNLVAVFIIQLLWTFGLHGSSIVGSVMNPIWLGFMDENRLALEKGAEQLPNIFTLQFFEPLIYMGGGGCTFALVVLMFFRSRSKQMKQLGKLAIGPGIFNINEPLVFGLPIVLNPIMMIPFILTPIVLTIFTYITMSLGWVAQPAGIAVPWTIPPIIGGYLVTGGKISGAVIQLVNFIISLAIYYPFFRAWDKQKYKEENNVSPTDVNAKQKVV